MIDQEVNRSVPGGVLTDAGSTTFGRTDLRISASKAKNHEESFAEVRFHVAPQKPRKNREKLIFEPKFSQFFGGGRRKSEMSGIV